MDNELNQDEKNLHELFTQIRAAFDLWNYRDARAGLQLIEEELNAGAGIYGLIFYTRALMAVEKIDLLITAHETATKKSA